MSLQENLDTLRGARDDLTAGNGLDEKGWSGLTQLRPQISRHSDLLGQASSEAKGVVDLLLDVQIGIRLLMDKLDESTGNVGYVKEGIEIVEGAFVTSNEKTAEAWRKLYAVMGEERVEIEFQRDPRDHLCFALGATRRLRGTFNKAGADLEAHKESVSDLEGAIGNAILTVRSLGERIAAMNGDLSDDPDDPNTTITGNLSTAEEQGVAAQDAFAHTLTSLDSIINHC